MKCKVCGVDAAIVRTRQETVGAEEHIVLIYACRNQRCRQFQEPVGEVSVAEGGEQDGKE